MAFVKSGTAIKCQTKENSSASPCDNCFFPKDNWMYTTCSQMTDKDHHVAMVVIPSIDSADMNHRERKQTDEWLSTGRYTSNNHVVRRKKELAVFNIPIGRYAKI